MEKGVCNLMNNKTNWKQWLTAGIVVGALVLAALAVAPMTTFAQSDDGSSDQPAAPAMPWARGGMRGFDMQGFDMGEMRGEYQGFLADALGITVEELQAAQLKARDAMIDKAVADGTLTQEQADLMKARQAFMQYYAAENAQTLEDALNAAVEAGAITQEQADLLLEQQGQMGRGFFGRGMPDGGMFGEGMRGGFRGQGGQFDFHHRGMMPGFDGQMPGFDGQMPGRGGRMMPGYQAPTPTPEANS